ncbi:hypothetical protein ACVINW_002119 [Bradyrhizobium sp. USDA 4461]
MEAEEGKSSTFVCNNIRDNNPCLIENHRSRGMCAGARIMGDEAWREKPRSVTLSDLVQIISKETPAALWKDTFAWVLSRAG